MLSIIEQDFEKRLCAAVFEGWRIFQHKAGNDYICINNDVSMKLHYANILQGIFPLIVYDKNEHFDLELEKTVNLPNGTDEVDVFVTGCKGDKKHSIAIKLKCYKEASVLTGKPGGAVNDICNSVYKNLEILKSNCRNGLCSETMFYIMTDIANLAEDLHNSKNSKDGFEWTQNGDYYFLERPFLGGKEGM